MDRIKGAVVQVVLLNFLLDMMTFHLYDYSSLLKLLAVVHVILFPPHIDLVSSLSQS